MSRERPNRPALSSLSSSAEADSFAKAVLDPEARARRIARLLRGQRMCLLAAAALVALACVGAATDVIMLICSVAGALVCLFRMAFLGAQMSQLAGLQDDGIRLKCPFCGFDGEFEQGKVPFLVFGLLDVSRERAKAKRKHVCPECGTEIVLPRSVVSG